MPNIIKLSQTDWDEIQRNIDAFDPTKKERTMPDGTHRISFSDLDVLINYLQRQMDYIDVEMERLSKRKIKYKEQMEDMQRKYPAFFKTEN